MKNAPAVILLLTVGLNLLGCASTGTTIVQSQHHLLAQDSSMVSVCFMRPKPFFNEGVWRKPIEIKVDGEDLMSFSLGRYIFLDLQPGKYDMTVKSWTTIGEKAKYKWVGDPSVYTQVSPGNEKEVETTRDYFLTLGEVDSVYLLFTLEKLTVGEYLSQEISKGFDAIGQALFPDTITISISGVQLGLVSGGPVSSKPEPQPWPGYTVESINRQTAAEEAEDSEPVDGTQEFPK